MMLSLDIATYMANEMDAKGFLSDGLRDLARREIREMLKPNNIEDIDLDALTSKFTSSVLQELGSDVLNAVLSWQEIAFPKHPNFSRLWIWTILAEQLRHAWDDGLSEKKPLFEPEMIDIRLQLRDYSDHISNIRTEIELIQESTESEWDKEIRLHCSDWFNGPSHVSEVCQNICSSKFWDLWLKNLTKSQIDRLQEWGREQAKLQKMPLRYIQLPLW